MTRALAIALLGSACASEAPPPVKPGGDSIAVGSGCVTHADCEPGELCMYAHCVPRPADIASGPTGPLDAVLVATPTTLNFGTLTPPQSRRLTVVLENSGTAMVTLSAVTLAPANSPFAVEPLGTGPFWIRPGRSREIFVRFTPPDNTPVNGFLRVESEAPTLSLPLLGN